MSHSFVIFFSSYKLDLKVNQSFECFTPRRSQYSHTMTIKFRLCFGFCSYRHFNVKEIVWNEFSLVCNSFLIFCCNLWVLLMFFYAHKFDDLTTVSSYTIFIVYCQHKTAVYFVLFNKLSISKCHLKLNIKF